MLGGTTIVVPSFGGGGLLLLRLMQPVSVSGTRTTRAERSRCFMLCCDIGRTLEMTITGASFGREGEPRPNPSLPAREPDAKAWGFASAAPTYPVPGGWHEVEGTAAKRSLLLPNADGRCLFCTDLK